MGISLKPEHLKRYKDIALLIGKYGRPGLLKQAGLDEVVDDGSPNGEKNGELTRSIGLHGIYRLSQSSAIDLSALMESPPAAAPRIPRPGSDRRAMPAPGDALF